MIIKPRVIPPDIDHLEMLLQRLKSNHPVTPQVEGLLSTKRAGWTGEHSLDFHLDYLLEPHVILHNLRLYDGRHFFQVDTLILFPTFILIIEAKNMKGQISIHREKKEMRRDLEGFQGPVEQAERQKELLQEWLLHQLGLSLPVDFLVVFTNRRCVLEFDSSDSRIHEKVIRATSLVGAIERKKEFYQEKVLTRVEMMRVGRALADAHQELVPNYMKRFNLGYSDLQEGVMCPECGKYFMKRAKKKWVCVLCSYSSYSAHEQALREYAALVSKVISNKEAQEFLKISSRHVVYRILSAYARSTVGGGKYIKYLL
ncbi:nuclease-related domain-containing protein [Halobacillus litoralis]|uniref:nuclease-related domain-containing protein n=1 Tax=Halobacillus litoralis TaxID=45668 RepID=UPI001CFF53C8|nr:nuclease-related domain-containing protein [Halobacillus litoralis]WLR48336.1 nuclease-related domain-containing protein [Halobacillus litoralis]